jgi:sulfide:quinone oxidoreductase
MPEVRRRFLEVRDRARRGQRQRVLFLVPPNNKCSGPLYEIVFMLETWLRRQCAREHVDITWSTYEHRYIQAVGPRLHDLVTTELAQRGISGYVQEVVSEVRPGEVRYADGSSRQYDHLIAFPPYVAAVRYGSLPSNDRGFLATELETRLASGHDDVYAPGDAGDFPIKQAFLAFLQADAVAEHIAADVTGREFSRPFDPVSMCIMEMGKKMLGFAVPMRFAAGDPFHAGRTWQAMDMGIKAMTGLLAD